MMTLKLTRIVKSATNFNDLGLRCPRDQIHKLKRLKKYVNRNLTRLNSLEPELPRIHWEFYRANMDASSHALIDELKEMYTNFVVPRPTDATVEKYEKLMDTVKQNVEAYNNKSNEKVTFYEEARQAYCNSLSFAEMTMEDYAYMFPEDAPNFLAKPTFWPHSPEEQVGFVRPKTSN